MLKKSFSLFISFCFAVFFISIFTLNAQSLSNSALSASRRTAIRYLQLAKQYASDKQWKEADSNAKMGLAYDDKISDLWYLRAVSQANLGEKKSDVLKFVIKALNDGEWVDYNRDGARILYSDVLCTLRRFEQALSVLDSSPFIYSADAEYIRSKIYYCLGDEENIKKARSRLDSARRIYPSDSRFAELFYEHEYQILRKTNFISPELRSLADAFSLMISRYKNSKKDLELYAAVFASDEQTGKSDSKKVRMLKAFNSKHLTSPIYALEALKTNLLTEDAALDYFYKFSDDTIELSVLEDFSSLLKDENVKKEFSEYLNSYNGTVIADTDGDLNVNMVISYNRGRPKFISYDLNQDDENEWASECDFGVPLKISLSENALELEYSSWPYVSSAIYKMPKFHKDLAFSLVAETLSWTPFVIQPDKIIKDSLSSDFFIPVLSEEIQSVSGDDLMRAALGYTYPSGEKEGAVIQVSLLNGVPQVANYFIGEKNYAFTHFENGIPVFRKVDVDGDGLYETSEYYGYTKDSSKTYISTVDEMQIMTNLFGEPATGTGFYIEKITVDRNGDTIPDFIEEYLPASEGKRIPGKISSWDTNGDGNWDVQYKKYPSSIDGKLREEANFHQPLTDSIVTVSSENGIPVFVKNGDEILSIAKGNKANFYWISSAGTNSEEVLIENEINQINEQGVSIIVDGNLNFRRFLAVRIEKMIFAMEIQK